ncbi:hypothetical protein BC829DRAFT_166030 [Chytridium lagenaria]|nr:hypothetical protein BC829DRAFT_166030 [Chytridium lagenaria]
MRSLWWLVFLGSYYFMFCEMDLLRCLHECVFHYTFSPPCLICLQTVIFLSFLEYHSYPSD